MCKKPLKPSVKRCAFVAAFTVLWLSAYPAAARDTLVFAAASTADALNAALGQYTDRTGATVRVSYASSGALARHIDHGAPAALYISANVAWVAWLDERGRLARQSRVPLFGNRLVLIEPKSEGIKDFTPPKHVMPTQSNARGRPDIRSNIMSRHRHKLAIADPAHAPAGAYAEEALKSMGLWKTASTMAVLTRDVRAALLLVERGEAALGIVYKSDAERSTKVRILNTISHNTHRPIRYLMAIIEEQDSRATRRLYAFLQSLPAKAIFGRFRFDTKKNHGPVKSR